MNNLRHLLVQEFQLRPGAEWASPGGCYWFLHIVRGESYWLGPPQPRFLTPGEVLVVAPSAAFTIRASQLSGVLLRGFSFVPEDILGFFTLTERQRFEAKLAAQSEAARFLPSTHPVSRRMAGLLPPQASGTALGQRAEALEVVAAVFDGHAPTQPPPIPLARSALQRFGQLIAEMPELEIINYSPVELARMCGCGVRHFHRLFRNHFGVPTRERQAELRLVRACQLLQATDADLAVVVQQCGFRSAKKFNQLFRARFGMGPVEWRQARRHLEDAAGLAESPGKVR